MGGPPEVKSILVFSGLELIGDGLIKLPFLRALRAAWPDGHIVWLAGYGNTVFADSLAELVSPYLDEVLSSAGVGNRWRELARRPLAGRRFDVVIDTQSRVKTTLILRRIEHGIFVSRSAGFVLSDRKPARSYRRSRHMVDDLFKLVELASGRLPQLDRRLALPPSYMRAAETALPGGGPYVGFAPGAGGQHKRWPLERFLGVAAEISGNGYRPVCFLGPNETEWEPAVRAACPAALLPLQDGAVEPEIARSPIFTIACAQRLEAAVANDSGAGHLFAAADTRLVSLFGPTRPTKFAPVVTRGEIVCAQDFGGSEMARIPADAVRDALRRLIATPT